MLDQPPKRRGRPPLKKPQPFKISYDAISAIRPLRKERIVQPFSLPRPPPGVVPPGMTGLAYDDNVVIQRTQWAMNYYGQRFTEGLEFLGYPYLSELMQRAEYRNMVETLAEEMTRKGWRLSAKGDADKSKKIDKIKDEMDRFQVRDRFRQIYEQGSSFGRAHLYIDTGDTDNPNELKMDIGSGRSDLSKRKIGKGDIRGFKCIEPIWTYPQNYNSTNPLKDDWYKPETWIVMQQEIHASRLLTFIPRPVPDILKPAYMFGGLSLTQMAKPYVDNWLKTRQSVNDAISAYSVFVLLTDMMGELQGGGEDIDKRLDHFVRCRDNKGVMAIDKNLEDLKNVSMALGSLDKLQAQAQEHQSAVAKIPLIKLLGITPSGLNASSEDEMQCFGETIAAAQEAEFRPHLTKVIDFIQLNLFGEVDQDIIFEFEPLKEMTELELAQVGKMKADTHDVYLTQSVISPEEVRQVLADDPDTEYPGLDVEDLPELKMEQLPAEQQMGMQTEHETKVAKAKIPPEGFGGKGKAKTIPHKPVSNKPV